VFPVYAEANDPEQISGCAHRATAIVTVVYLLVGIVGALAFQSPGKSALRGRCCCNIVAVSWCTLPVASLLMLRWFLMLLWCR
jgi:hypothetical protein